MATEIEEHVCDNDASTITTPCVAILYLSRTYPMNTEQYFQLLARHSRLKDSKTKAAT